MAEENNRFADQVPPINEDFIEGGDLTVRSAERVEFSIHSIIFSVASPVFSELLQMANRNEVFRFTENTKVLALILNFLYPRPTPTVSSMELLNDALRVANKYQIDSVKRRLREQLVHVDSPVSVSSNPLGVLYIASMQGFTREAELAADIASRRWM